MELLWRICSLFVSLQFLELCNCLPLNLQSAAQDVMQWEWSASMLTLMVAACFLITIAGCVCCQHRKGFQEFTDASINISAGNLVNNDVEQGSSDPGHVNPIAMTAILEPNSEFTIFRPLSPLHYNNNVFTAQPTPMQTLSSDSFLHSGMNTNDVIDDDFNEWLENSPIRFSRNRLKYIREIGRGWFGRVIEGEAQNVLQEQNIQPVVVRVLDAAACNKDRSTFLREVKPYIKLSHSNILKVHGGCLEAPPLLIIQEHCSKGDLKIFLKENCNELQQHENTRLLQMSFELADALYYLHQNKIIHPDLAARNCQVSADLSMRLGDYGLAVQKYPQDYYPGAPHVPVRWCAPETVSCTDTTIQPLQLTYSANVWSLGVTIWEIISFGIQPYNNLSDDDVVSQVLGSPHVSLPEPLKLLPFTHNLYLLSQLCCSPYELRPEISQVYSMLVHLFNSYTSSKLESIETLSDSDFQTRWDSFKPNTIVKTDNHRILENESSDGILETTFSVKTDDSLKIKIDSIETSVPEFKSDRYSLTAVHFDPNLSPSTESTENSECFNDTRLKSASLTNLHGSFENLTDIDGVIEKIKSEYDINKDLANTSVNETSFNAVTVERSNECNKNINAIDKNPFVIDNSHAVKSKQDIVVCENNISDFNSTNDTDLNESKDNEVCTEKSNSNFFTSTDFISSSEEIILNSSDLQQSNTLQKEEYESWLLNVASEYPSDPQYIKGLSQALKDLDTALAEEKTSSSSCTDSSHRPSPGPDSLVSDSKSNNSSNRSSKLVEVSEQIELSSAVNLDLYVSEIPTDSIPEDIVKMSDNSELSEENENGTKKKVFEQVSHLSKEIHPMSVPNEDLKIKSKSNSLTVDFQLGPISSFPLDSQVINRTLTPQPESLLDSMLFCRSNSGSETEDETWRKRIERGAYSEKVRQKSKSVTDLMVLTHIDTDTDSETPLQSLDNKINFLKSFSRGNYENINKNYGSEGNLNVVHYTFQEELKKLQEARRDSLLFVPVPFHTDTEKSLNDVIKVNMNENEVSRNVDGDLPLPINLLGTKLDVSKLDKKEDIKGNNISDILLSDNNIELEINQKQVNLNKGLNFEKNISNDCNRMQPNFENNDSKESMFLIHKSPCESPVKNEDLSSFDNVMSDNTTKTVSTNPFIEEGNTECVQNIKENIIENSKEKDTNASHIFSDLKSDYQKDDESTMLDCVDNQGMLVISQNVNPFEQGVKSLKSLRETLNESSAGNVFSENLEASEDCLREINSIKANEIETNLFLENEIDVNNTDCLIKNEHLKLNFSLNDDQTDDQSPVSHKNQFSEFESDGESFNDNFRNYDLAVKEDKIINKNSTSESFFHLPPLIDSVSSLSDTQSQFLNVTSKNNMFYDNSIQNEKIGHSSSVILGPCDDYTLDLYSGLKTIYNPSSEVELCEENYKFSSNFIPLNNDISTVETNKQIESIPIVPEFWENKKLNNNTINISNSKSISTVHEKNSADLCEEIPDEHFKEPENLIFKNLKTYVENSLVLTPIIKNFKDRHMENDSLTPDSLELDNKIPDGESVKIYAETLVNEIISKAEKCVFHKTNSIKDTSENFNQKEMIVLVREIVESVIEESIKKIQELRPQMDFFYSKSDQQNSNTPDGFLNESIIESVQSDVLSMSQLDSLEYSVNYDHQTLNNSSFSENTDIISNQTVIKRDLDDTVVVNKSNATFNELKSVNDFEVYQQYEIDKDSVPSLSEVMDSCSSKVTSYCSNQHNIYNLNEPEIADTLPPIQDSSQTYDIDDKTFICDSQIADLNDMEINLDDCFEESHILDSTYGVVNENNDHDGFSLEGGWFLHPQGSGVASSSEDPDSPPASDNSYVGFSLDEECVAALRNELAAKLPHARGPMIENDQEEWENEPATSEQHDEIVLRYNIYTTPLSPIPEESEEYECLTPDITHCRDDSDSDYDWSAEGGCDTDSRTPRASSPGIGVGGCRSSRRHTPSLDSCCSNDTLFNIEDINGSTIMIVPFEHDTSLLKTMDDDKISLNRDESSANEGTIDYAIKECENSNILLKSTLNNEKSEFNIKNNFTEKETIENIRMYNDIHEALNTTLVKSEDPNKTEFDDQKIVDEKHISLLLQINNPDTSIVSSKEENNPQKVTDDNIFDLMNIENKLKETSVNENIDNLCSCKASDTIEMKSSNLNHVILNELSENAENKKEENLLDVKNNKNCIHYFLNLEDPKIEINNEENIKLENKVDDSFEFNKLSFENQHTVNENENSNINEILNSSEIEIQLHESQLTDTENNTNTLHSDCQSSTEKLEAEPSTQEVITDCLNSKSEELLISEQIVQDVSHINNIKNEVTLDNDSKPGLEYKTAKAKNELIKHVNIVDINIQNYNKIKINELNDDFDTKLLDSIACNISMQKRSESPEGSYTMSDILSYLEDDIPQVEQTELCQLETTAPDQSIVSSDKTENLKDKINIDTVQISNNHLITEEKDIVSENHKISYINTDLKMSEEKLSGLNFGNENRLEQNTFNEIQAVDGLVLNEQSFNCTEACISNFKNENTLFLELESDVSREEPGEYAISDCMLLENEMKPQSKDSFSARTETITDNSQILNNDTIYESHKCVNHLDLNIENDDNLKIVGQIHKLISEDQCSSTCTDISSVDTNLINQKVQNQSHNEAFNKKEDVTTSNNDILHNFKLEPKRSIDDQLDLSISNFELNSSNISEIEMNQIPEEKKETKIISHNVIHLPFSTDNEIEANCVNKNYDHLYPKINDKENDCQINYNEQIEYETSTSFSDAENFDDFQKNDITESLYENLEKFDDITARKFYENIPTSPVRDDVIESIYENIGNVSKFDSLNYLQRKKNKESLKKSSDREDDSYENIHIKPLKMNIETFDHNVDLGKHFHIYDSVADDLKSDSTIKTPKLDQSSSLEDTSTITESIYDNVMPENKLDYANFCIDMTTTDYSDGSLKEDDHTYDKVCISEDLYSDLTDIRFSGPCDAQLMSTSFSDAHVGSDDQEWDSSSDSRSSSSGEFVWKEGEHESAVRVLHAPSEGLTLNQIEELSRMEVITEESSSSGEDEEGIEFVPSAWDSQATPTKSALRSPDKNKDKSDQKKRGVWFKKQKYHCVYEYPREPDMSPPEWIQTNDFSLWGTPSASDLSHFADWDLDTDTLLENAVTESQTDDSADKDLDDDNGAAVLSRYTRRDYFRRADDLYRLADVAADVDFTTGSSMSDDDFYISSSARPFQTYSLSSQFFPGQFQFVPDSTKSKTFDDIKTERANSIINFANDLKKLHANLHDKCNNTLGQGFMTPDSGVEDITPASIPDNTEFSDTSLLSKNKKTKFEIKSLKVLAENAIKNAETKLDKSMKYKTIDVLGGLRHTRNRLKLDLPPSPNSFSASKTFDLDVNNDLAVNSDSNVARSQDMPTFTTFGKTRFSIKHVETPTEELDVFKVPLMPKIVPVIAEINSSSTDTNSPEAIDISQKSEQSETDSVIGHSELIESGKRRSMEIVRGEASLLDSADEDSGIESSTNATLERQT